MSVLVAVVSFAAGMATTCTLRWVAHRPTRGALPGPAAAVPAVEPVHVVARRQVVDWERRGWA